MKIEKLEEATMKALESYWDVTEDEEFEFVKEVEEKIKKVFPQADVFEEPSGQAGQGTDYFYITIDGKEYTYKFDLGEENSRIYEDGPSAAADYYAKQIISKLQADISPNKKDKNASQGTKN